MQIYKYIDGKKDISRSYLSFKGGEMKDSELAVMMAMGIFETLKDKKILDENDIIKSLIKLQKDGEKKK